MVFRRPESVLVLIYNRAGEVLLIQRVDDPDFWQSVTGALEFDELPIDAAARELFEETGIRVSEMALSIVDHQRHTSFEISGVWRKRYRPEHTHNKEHVFSLQLPERIEPVLDALEHSAFVWLPAEQALKRATSPTNRQAIEEVCLAN